LARRYDFSRNPLDFAQSQVVLAKHHRSRLLSDFVKDGDSWDRVRYGYELTLSMQTRAVSMMANWIGGAFVYRDKKGDPNGRHPVEVVPAKQQRDAMNFVLTESFRDDAFGLTPELTRSMGLDKWLDDRMSFSSEATWPIHDRIMGIQASSLTMLMNPTTLKRVYDNEVRVPESEDSLTLPELMGSVSKEIWSELDQKGTEKFTVRKPLISSLRRNLQREHVERLIDLTLPGGGSSAAARAISMLASENL
ncbi:MAG: zinc-dependent metalloprotease, partial [Planctomycetaceae bacterium]|nr:zinc-dependent metalloprotease [Planctomycetaceae bacterium]